MTKANEYLPRALDNQIASTLAELPGLLLVGPRAVGKTTTALRHAKSVVRLDREAESAAFRADPDAALRGLEEPVLIDEWQAVPQVLGAIKRAIDNDTRPGRYIVTGSVRGRVSSAVWPATGRLAQLTMFGLTIREQYRRIDNPSFLERLLRDGADLESGGGDSLDLRDYLELALRSGYPEPALRLGEATRTKWLLGYVEQIVTRDAETVDRGRDPDRMRRFLEAYAAFTAGVVGETTLVQAAGLDRRTAVAYEQLMTNLFVVERLPAWVTNRVKRLTRSPKRYVIDAAIAAVLLRASVETVIREGTLLGGLLETFVVAQLRSELAALNPFLRIHHLRVQSGRHEVDVVVELDGGEMIGFEVKAASAVTLREDARHLAWMRDELGRQFKVGIVFHTGPRSYVLDERILAVPISALWQ